jgi:hypothetical protein
MQQPPSQNAGGVSGELRSDAQQLGSSAANRLHSEVDARKDAAVSQAQSVSSAIRQTADGLDESAPAWLRSAFQQGAQQIQRFADSIENKDSRQLMSEAQNFARNNPGTFLAACAAAGFAAARIFKAGGEQQSSQQFGSSSQFGQSQYGQSQYGQSQYGQSQSDQGQSWGDGEQAFGSPGRYIDPSEQSSSGTSRPFIAGSESGGQGGFGSSDQQFSGSLSDDASGSQQDDPLVLGTGGEAGRPIRDDGDFR